MYLTVANLKSHLTGTIHGASLNKVKNLTDLIDRSAWSLLSQIDPAETKRIQQLTNALHDSIYDYQAPSDLKGRKVIDIRPQVNRELGDNFSQGFAEAFDIRKALSSGKDIFTVQHNSGAKSLRIAKILTSPTVINTVNDVDDNGTWEAGGGASNLTKDTVDYVSGKASLNFDADTSTTPNVENDDMTQVDLTDHDERSIIFIWVYLPSASAITNVILRWGNDTSNYWSRTVTERHDATAFQDGWNLLAFDWNGATETGTVDPAGIDYVRVTITKNATADTDFRIDNIVSSLGKKFEIEYYSKFLFRTSSGTWKEKTTDDEDIINLDTESYNLFIAECMMAISQQLQGEDSSFDVSFYKTMLYGDPSSPDQTRRRGAYKQYMMANPSEVIKQQSRYYRLR